MARYRMIKPEFWEDDKLAECSAFARLLFISLWNFSDDQGFIEFRIKWLKTKCLPYDNVDIAKLINELVKVDAIEIRNEIILIKNFLKHQKIDKPRPSDLSQIFNNSTNSRDASTNGREASSALYINKDKINKEEERGEEENGEIFSPSPTPTETMKDFIQMNSEKNDRYILFVQEVAQSKKIPPEIVRAKLAKFINYWCEKTRDGKKERWQTEKVFEVQRRLSTWFTNANKFSSNKSASSGVAVIR